MIILDNSLFNLDVPSLGDGLVAGRTIGRCNAWGVGRACGGDLGEESYVVPALTNALAFWWWADEPQVYADPMEVP